MDKLIEIIEQEYQILKSVSNHLESQKSALIEYDVNSLERETNQLIELIKKLKIIEEERINFIAREHNISKRDAIKLKFSQIFEHIAENDKIAKLKQEFTKIIPQIVSTNSINNLLANRAINSLGEILTILSNGRNSVCNVKI